MSSRSRNFRRRYEDDSNGDEKTPASIASTTSKQTPARSKPKPSTLLSFADDEEDESPVVPIRTAKPSSSGKSSSIHKLTSAKERGVSATPAPPIPSNVQPQAGEYTKERLRELQKNARPLGSMPKSSQLPSSDLELVKPPKPEAPAEPVIVLKGLVKPVPLQEKEKQVVGERQRKEVELEVGDDSEEDNQRFAKLGIDGKGKDPSLIPDQATINAIRAKRERLRQSRAAAPDYISLDGGGVTSTRAPSVGGSSDDEESDFRGRISLLGDTKDSAKKKGVFEIVEEQVVVEETRVVGSGYDDEDDEEERRWEEEQFRKGLGKRLEEASSHALANGAPTVVPIQPPPPVYPQQVLLGSGSVGAGIGVSRSAEVLSIPQQAAVATRALQESIGKLKESHSRSMSSLVRTDNNLAEALSTITDLEKSLEAAGKKFIYMQELRNFISVICDFLQDKAPFIEELEEQMQKLHEDRASAVLERRTSDIADEMAEVEAAVNAAMSVLSKGSGSAYVSAATTAAQAASAAARENLNLPVQLDEFGRDLNLQKRMDSARRAESRKLRKDRSETKRISLGSDNATHLVEGECSTDESDSEMQAYQSSQDELIQTAEQIFSDAADEYSNLSVIKERIEEWKRQYSGSYRDAYMSLSAPDIFSPYVRLELLKWDPLFEDLDFNDMKWHTLLFDYGLRENESNFDPDDADANLIPQLVEKVALPILHHEIAHCWDTFSTKRTKNAVSATKLVVNYIPPSSEALRDLLSIVRSRLNEAVTNLTVPNWSTTVIKIVPDAAPVAAYRFGMSVRLLKNICLWKNVLALPVLEDIALVELLSGKVLPHLYSIMSNIHDAFTRTERVIASLSGVWSGFKGEHCPKLQPLVDCVAELGRKLEKRHASGVGGDTLGLARRLKKMMVELNQYDRAKAISRTFQIKDAL